MCPRAFVIASLSVLTLAAGSCAHSGESPQAEQSAALTLERQGSTWSTDDQGHLSIGTLLYILDTTPLAGAKAPPPIGVARVSGHHDKRANLELLWARPDINLSESGLNTLAHVPSDEGVRVGASFGEVDSVTEDGALSINLGALDGVYGGATYEVIDFRRGGEPVAKGTCRVSPDDIFQSHVVCRPDTDLPRQAEGLFVALVSKGADIAAQGSITAAGCKVRVPEGGALAAIGEAGVCALLDFAYDDFASRFGPLGEGGSLGIYLDQTYLDPNYVPEDIDNDWTVPPERARMSLRVRDWLEDDSQRVLVIFGPMGAGKTTFSRRFAYDLAIETATRGQGVIPVRVSLSDVLIQGEIMGEGTGLDLIARVIQRTTLKDVSREQIQADILTGALLPFFDGFDEVSLGGRVMEAVDYYQELVAGTVGAGGKMIVLTRSSDKVGEPLAGLTLALDQHIQATPDQTQLQLVPFTDTVVTQYLERLVPDPELRARTQARLEAAFDLQTLAQTPVLVYLVANYVANESSGDEMPAEVYSLYRQYTGDWAEEILGEKHNISREQLESFLWRCVAMGMALDLDQTPAITEPVLSSFISSNTWLQAPTEVDETWQLAMSEARGAAFIQPAPTGGYRFVDPSFAHYFAAEGWIQSLIFVWEDDAPSWAPAPIIKRLERLNPSDATLRFLREGMGPDPLADRGILSLMENATSEEALTILYRLRLMRQGLAGRITDDAIARRSRFSFQELYDEESQRLRGETQSAVEHLIATEFGSRYEAIDGEPGVLKDTKDGTLWAFIPARSYITGAVGDAGTSLTMKELSQPVLMSLMPVTNQQYWDFYQQSGYDPHASLYSSEVVPFLEQFPRARMGSGDRGLKFPEEIANLPVTAVSWLDVEAFAQWRSKTVGATVRIPNEHEWELAARGTLGRRYPWGDVFETNRALSKASETSGVIPVDTMPAGRSAYGLYHAAGNVREWVIQEDRATFNRTGVLRGGSYHSAPTELAVFSRDAGYDRAEFRFADAGFRLVREIPDEALQIETPSPSPLAP